MSKLIISFLLLSISISLHSQNQQQSFSDNLPYPVFEATEKYNRFNSEILKSEVILTKALGDLNADGIKDFAIFNFNKFSIHMSNDVANPEFIYTPEPKPTYLNIDAGDFNGDGYSDLIVLNGYDSENSDTKIEFYFGGSDFDLAADKVIEVYSDLNGDGFDELIVGYAGNSDVCIYFGASEMLTDATPDMVLNSSYPMYEAIHESFTWSIESGDFNSDSYDDLIITPLYMRTENLAQEGIRAMHLFYGSENFDTQVDKLLKIPSACFDINITQFVNQFYGKLTAIPDLNNDGSNELLIGGGTVINNKGHLKFKWLCSSRNRYRMHNL